MASAELADLVRAIENEEGLDELCRMRLPGSYRALCLDRRDTHLFDGIPPASRDPSKTLHLREVPVPPIAADEVLLAVMASSVNFNTVWSSIFFPVPTFTLLQRLGAEGGAGKRHDEPYHVIGSDASGVVLCTGSAVRKWKVGDRVVVHCNHVDDQDPWQHDDAMLARNQRIWGYETNFGGLADLAVVKANQLLPKPGHLTWEEAASTGLCASTAYRMLVSSNGAPMKQGDVVLIWGATGGLGSYAIQFVLNGGGVPVGVVSSADKAELLHRMGCAAVINRADMQYRFWRDEHTQDQAEWRRLGQNIRELVGDDPDIVFEHPGRETLGASVYVTRRGGTIVTCAATTGYHVEFDNRHLWMKLKTIKASHFANYREAWDANRLIARGAIHPTLSATYGLEGAAEAVARVHRNSHRGKVGVLCLAPHAGGGVTNYEMRQEIGEDVLTRFAESRAVCEAPSTSPMRTGQPVIAMVDGHTFAPGRARR